MSTQNDTKPALIAGKTNQIKMQIEDFLTGSILIFFALFSGFILVVTYPF